MITVKDLKKYISYILFIFGESVNVVGLINALIHQNGKLSIIFTTACLVSMTLLFLVSLKWKKHEWFIQIIVMIVGILYFPLIFWRTKSPTTFILNTFLIPVSYAITVSKKRDFIIPLLNLIIYDVCIYFKLTISHLVIFTIIYLYVLFVPSLFSLLITDYSNQLRIENERVNNLANKDALTNLYNRTYLSQFYNKWICIPIMTDIDFFKKINDHYGHDEGDRILKNLAKIFLKYQEDKFKIFRYGGEEFIILSVLEEDLTFRKIIDIVNDVRQNLKTNDDKGVTISVGIGDRDNFDERAIKRADMNLYLSKNSGRNCVSKNNEIFYK